MVRLQNSGLRADAELLTLCSAPARLAVRRAIRPAYCSGKISREQEMGFARAMAGRIRARTPAAFGLDRCSPFTPGRTAKEATDRRGTEGYALFGDEHWVQQTSRQLKLDSTLRPHGRPKKES